MSASWGRISADLDRLRSAQAELATPASAHQRQAAAHRRAQMEQSIKRMLDVIEQTKEKVAHHQALYQKLDKIPVGERSPNIEHEMRFHGHEAATKLAELNLRVARAKEEFANLKPKIEWARRVEAGMSEDDATKLAEIEAASASHTDGIARSSTNRDEPEVINLAEEDKP